MFHSWLVPSWWRERSPQGSTSRCYTGELALVTFVGHRDVELLMKVMRILYTKYNKSFYSMWVVQSVAPKQTKTPQRNILHRCFKLNLIFICERASSHFQPGEGPRKDLLRDCEIFAKVRFHLCWADRWRDGGRNPGHISTSSNVRSLLPDFYTHLPHTQSLILGISRLELQTINRRFFHNHWEGLY